ncbi:MAG: DUF3108 domain-containing protein [Bacteroidales bacterium]|nr:DUF3108 domain-containing protein [Bacteroidales bacterium]
MPILYKDEASHAFGAGEHLDYSINYQLLGIRSEVGYAKVDLSEGDTVNGSKTFHAVAYGETAPFFDSFFKVRDRYESRFRTGDIKPVWFARDVHEGKYEVTNDLTWSPDRSQIEAKVAWPNRKNKDTVLVDTQCTFDILTLFYYARNMDFDALKEGRNNPVSFAIDNEKFNIYFRYIGPEEKSVPGLGTFKTLKFAAKVVAGEVFDGKHELMIWVSDDACRIPVYFESPVIVGRVLGRLTSWDNTRHPLTSLIKKK